jgi:hypothetical protein
MGPELLTLWLGCAVSELTMYEWCDEHFEAGWAVYPHALGMHFRTLSDEAALKISPSFTKQWSALCGPECYVNHILEIIVMSLMVAAV